MSFFFFFITTLLRRADAIKNTEKNNLNPKITTVYSQRTPYLPRNHAPFCIYRQLIGEFQVFLFICFIVCYKANK